MQLSSVFSKHNYTSYLHIINVKGSGGRCILIICTVYNVHVHCTQCIQTLYSVQCTVYSVQCIYIHCSEGKLMKAVQFYSLFLSWFNGKNSALAEARISKKGLVYQKITQIVYGRWAKM